jgi:hypothetical protein
LHGNGSTNPTGIDNKFNKIPFYPYFYIKDLFSLIIFLIIISYFVYFNPNALGHPDNYIKANPLVTPAHIVPEWYFLPFYAILRSIPDKLGGVLAMGLSLIILLLLPVINMPNKRSLLYSPLYKISYWFFLIIFIILGWIGQKAVETPFIEIGQVATLFYFFYFLVFLPIYSIIENNILNEKKDHLNIKNFFLFKWSFLQFFIICMLLGHIFYFFIDLFYTEWYLDKIEIKLYTFYSTLDLYLTYFILPISLVYIIYIYYLENNFNILNCLNILLLLLYSINTIIINNIFTYGFLNILIVIYFLKDIIPIIVNNIYIFIFFNFISFILVLFFQL